ncbi:MAG: OmpA family protein, partial [Bacteroidales bacterium]|nr:OmpA family protein [Bacteroidales bacterium]
LLKENAFVAPYLLGGLGGCYFDASGVGENGTFSHNKFMRPNLYGGLGVNFRLHPMVSLAVQTSLMAPLTDQADGVTGSVVTAPNKSNDRFLENSFSLRITPGKFKKKDSDGDGVPDKKDLCPNTPPGVAVDENGCPLDKDGDGVPDYKDECPDVAGLAAFNGCPDTDGDGIIDKNDACPDVAGIALLKGCPDSDGDGVADKDDRCPDTPKGWKVDRFGCPLDADRDGIPDSEDACPDQPGISELKGCPIDVGYLMSKYNLNNRNILFDFDHSNPQQAGVETLDDIYRVLSNHNQFGVEFDGYTDWVGRAAYNLKLSEKRANWAKDYLVKKGIIDNRIKTLFFGESKPAADNKTREGRQLNRRVEFNFFKLR